MKNITFRIIFTPLQGIWEKKYGHNNNVWLHTSCDVMIYMVYIAIFLFYSIPLDLNESIYNKKTTSKDCHYYLYQIIFIISSISYAKHLRENKDLRKGIHCF